MSGCKTLSTCFNFRVLLIFFIILTLLFASTPVEANASRPIAIIFNGRQLEAGTNPVSQNGRVFIPANTVARMFGMDIKFFSRQNGLALWNNLFVISLVVGHNEALLSNSQGIIRVVPLGSPVFIHSGRSMVPLRLVAEAFGVSITWVARDRTIIISSPPPVMPIRGTTHLPATQLNSNRRRMTPEEVIALIEPATVQIQTHPYENILRGSGFLIAPKGLVLTNAHVVRGVRDLFVVLRDGKRFRAQIVKINNRNDLALLRVINDSESVFPYIRHRAYRSAVFSGDSVISFGNPGNKRWFISEGTVTRVSDITLAPAWTKAYPLITHNAYTDRGSSGGVLVNLYGEWIGVNSLTAVHEELGYAVPADFLYELLGGGYYGLNCDWESYWTEYFIWQNELKKAAEIFSNGLNAPNGSQERSDNWRRALAITENARFFPLGFTPLFLELFHLPRLFITVIDARIAYYAYHVNTLDGRAVWTQAERDRLWNNVELAISEYNAELQRVSALVGNSSPYKTILP